MKVAGIDNDPNMCEACPYIGRCGQPTKCEGDPPVARTPRINPAFEVADMNPDDYAGQYLIATIGLPGSGKTSWTLRQIERLSPGFHRVNRDEIRRELGFKYDPRREDEVSRIQNDRIYGWLEKGHSVIVDDTHLDPHHLKNREEMAGQFEATFKTVSFMHVPVEECIKRDLSPARQRADQTVGKDVIETLYAKYWSKQWVPENGPGNPIILCDLDGTLCELPRDMKYPAAYNRDYTYDRHNEPVLTLLRDLESVGHTIVFLSGREDIGKSREQTECWLTLHGLDPSDLIMRAEGDVRPDYIVKKELYMRNIQGKYTVLYVVDDRPSVVRMWRNELGLPVFQVKPNVEF